MLSGKPTSGKRLGGYVLGTLISRGAMGAVYEAVHEDSGRPGVVKVLRPEYAQVESMRLRFVREAEVYRQLDHPCIAGYLGSGRQQGVDFLVLERVPGIPLREVIDRRHSLEVPLALSIARQLLEGLSHLHLRGIVHRDLKPANVLVAEDGRVKMVDFGLAAADDLLFQTEPGEALGSFLYSPPEQKMGETVDGRSDLYALGILIYEMISGKPPCVGRNLKDVFEAQLRAEFPPLTCRHGRVPEALQTFCLRLLRPRPEQRPSSAHEALSVLDPILRAEVAALEPPT